MSGNPMLEGTLVMLVKRYFTQGALSPDDREAARRIQRALGREVIRFVPSLLPADMVAFALTGHEPLGRWVELRKVAQ